MKPRDDAAVLEQQEALVGRAQAGDRAALQQLLEPHADVLFARVVLPRVGDRPTAEDILKATMVTAIEKLHTFRWQGRSIYHWLRQIAVNKVIDHHRKNRRTRKLAERVAHEPEVTMSAAAPGAEAALIAEQERRGARGRIDESLAKINPRYRRAIELRLVQERSRTDCADAFDIKVGAFDVLFFRALKAFRKVYEA